MKNRRLQSIHWKNFLLIGALFLLAVFLIVCNLTVFGKINRLRKGLAEFEKRFEREAAIKSAQEEKVLQGNSLFFLEKMAREELDYKKPGEKVVAFPRVDNSTSSHKIDLEGKPFWQWIISRTRE